MTKQFIDDDKYMSMCLEYDTLVKVIDDKEYDIHNCFEKEKTEYIERLFYLSSEISRMNKCVYKRNRL